VRHAVASEVVLSLALEVRNLVVRVRAQRSGFTPTGKVERDHGLGNLRARMEADRGVATVVRSWRQGRRWSSGAARHRRGVPIDSLMSIHVAIVEDDRVCGRTLTVLIDAARGFRCVATCPSAEDALKRLPDLAPDVVLMEPSIYRAVRGSECVARLRPLLPRTASHHADRRGRLGDDFRVPEGRRHRLPREARPDGRDARRPLRRCIVVALPCPATSPAWW